MKTFFTALALAAVITVPALTPAAAASQYGCTPQQKHDGCVYQGYPCCEWLHSGEDGW
jgi:hypothetical protein